MYALASVGLVCVSFLAGRRFPVVPHAEPDDDGGATLARPRLTGPVAASSAGVSVDAFADLDRRVSALERTARRRSRPSGRPERTERVERPVVAGFFADEAPLDKPATVSHYEALADQVARERRQDDVEPRGRVMKFPSRPLAIAREYQDR